MRAAMKKRKKVGKKYRRKEREGKKIPFCFFLARLRSGENTMEFKKEIQRDENFERKTKGTLDQN